MTVQQGQQQLRMSLQTIYDDREAANIANWVMEHLTGLSRVDRIVQQYDPLSAAQETQLASYTAALLDHKPVQYVLQEAWFYGMKLYVDDSVLIPRPETEELVEWIVSDHDVTAVHSRFASFDIIPVTGSQVLPTSDFLPPSPGAREFVAPIPRLIDIGTGSGCIPIALKKAFPQMAVYGCDVSVNALKVARRNAVAQEADIEWIQLNFLQAADWSLLPRVDVIVSNPPYIPLRDKEAMQHNVLAYEPHLALFVKDDDPLVFYRNIALFAKEKLLPGGSVYVEIHEELGEATRALFLSQGFKDVEVRKDMQGKDRMIRARDHS